MWLCAPPRILRTCCTALISKRDPHPAAALNQNQAVNFGHQTARGFISRRSPAASNRLPSPVTSYQSPVTAFLIAGCPFLPPSFGGRAGLPPTTLQPTHSQLHLLRLPSHPT